MIGGCIIIIMLLLSTEAQDLDPQQVDVKATCRVNCNNLCESKFGQCNKCCNDKEIEYGADWETYFDYCVDQCGGTYNSKEAQIIVDPPVDYTSTCRVNCNNLCEKKMNRCNKCCDDEGIVYGANWDGLIALCVDRCCRNGYCTDFDKCCPS